VQLISAGYPKLKELERIAIAAACIDIATISSAFPGPRVPARRCGDLVTFPLPCSGAHRLSHIAREKAKLPTVARRCRCRVEAARAQGTDGRLDAIHACVR
jgi:hypothetical protein